MFKKGPNGTFGSVQTAASVLDGSSETEGVLMQRFLGWLLKVLCLTSVIRSDQQEPVREWKTHIFRPFRLHSQ